jgi:acetate kinase
MTAAPDTVHPAVLTVNAGSSSVKMGGYTDENPPRCVCTNSVATTGAADRDAAAAIAWAKRCVGAGQLRAIVHRIVLSARRETAEPVTPALIATLRTACTSDAEHLPLQIALMEAFETAWEGVPGIACFDSAFHNSMPPVARLLPLPVRLRAAGLERFGFHGISCGWLMAELERQAGAAAADGRVILAHLGNGASMTAVRHGRSIDTTMGFTPVGGLVMATRAGELDPGAVAAICHADQLDPAGFNNLVNHESGLLAISGTSGDLRELLERSPGDSRATEAIEYFCYQARKWIGALAAVLGGVDTLVFAGGIGEHLPAIRQRICCGLEFLGIAIDAERNASRAAVISTKDSRATVRVIATDEGAMMARIAARALATGTIPIALEPEPP